MGDMSLDGVALDARDHERRDITMDPSSEFNLDESDHLQQMDDHLDAFGEFDEYSGFDQPGQALATQHSSAQMPKSQASVGKRASKSTSDPNHLHHLATTQVTNRERAPPSLSESNVGSVPPPPSTQDAIAQSRATAGSFFGQVTPPQEEAGTDSIAPSPPTKRSKSDAADKEGDAQRLRQERARNAAQMRHARNTSARKIRKDDNADGGDEVEVKEEDTDEKREKYREKNRLAAAKCRSKKKVNVNSLEERHRMMAAENNFRKREERELRDELTTLRTLALEHGLGRCQCGGLHSYNQAKAAEMALEHQIGGPDRSCLSPTQESQFADFPDHVLGFGGEHLSEQDHTIDHNQSGHPHNPQAADSHFESHRGQDPLAEMDADQAWSPEEDEMLGLHGGNHDDFNNFNDFLQSSPGGRHVFS